MSEANIDLVRRIFQSVNRETLMPRWVPRATTSRWIRSTSVGPAKGVYRGKEQVREVWASYMDAFDSLEWNPEEFIEVDDFRLIVVNHNRARGRGSGAEVDAVGAQLWTLRGGKAQSVRLYQSKADALEAAGLRE